MIDTKASTSADRFVAMEAQDPCECGSNEKPEFYCPKITKGVECPDFERRFLYCHVCA